MKPMKTIAGFVTELSPRVTDGHSAGIRQMMT
jgi:hypothetical protein